MGGAGTGKMGPSPSNARKGGRVVDCTGLENRQGASLRGFESHPFRQVRAAFALLVLVAPLPAGAAWLKVGEVGDAVLYVDPATIRKEGGFARVATLDDLKVAGPGGEISLGFMREFDCKAGRVRVIDAAAYSGPMATGRLLGSESGGRWNEVVPGTTGEDILKFVCGP